jgi:hypothetical protein
MGIQTLIIFLSLVSFVPDQEKADIPYQKYSLAQGQYQIAQNRYDQVITNPDNKISEKNGINKAGKFSIGADIGYSRIFGFGVGTDMDGNSFILGINGGYWINDRILAGLDFLYHYDYENTDYDGGPDIHLTSIIPQIRVCIPNLLITPTLGFGFGPVIKFFERFEYATEVTYLINLNGGIEYFFKDRSGMLFSAGINFAYNFAPEWNSRQDDYLYNSTSKYITIGFEVNHLF